VVSLDVGAGSRSVPTVDLHPTVHVPSPLTNSNNRPENTSWAARPRVTHLRHS
jgi:hypothetical protein